MRRDILFEKMLHLGYLAIVSWYFVVEEFAAISALNVFRLSHEDKNR